MATAPITSKSPLTKRSKVILSSRKEYGVLSVLCADFAIGLLFWLFFVMIKEEVVVGVLLHMHLTHFVVENLAQSIVACFLQG